MPRNFKIYLFLDAHGKSVVKSVFTECYVPCCTPHHHTALGADWVTVQPHFTDEESKAQEKFSTPLRGGRYYPYLRDGTRVG